MTPAEEKAIAEIEEEIELLNGYLEDGKEILIDETVHLPFIEMILKREEAVSNRIMAREKAALEDLKKGMKGKE